MPRRPHAEQDPGTPYAAELPKRLQMADVARLAGVSVATVSRALSDSPLVRHETRQRIRELAQSLRYSVNAGARDLRRGQNKTVAVVVPHDATTSQRLTDPFFLGMMGHIADVLTELGLDMLVSRVNAERLDDAAVLHESGRVMGVILIGQWQLHEQINLLAARSTPIVVWGARLRDQFYCSVGSDNRMGGRLATKHLIESGRRRIAFFGDRTLPEVALRYQGHVDALRAAGLPRDPRLSVQAPFGADGGRIAMQSLLAAKVPFDAVFACADVLAMSAIAALQVRGMRVPADVSVVGYDDVELAACAHPPLTTVKQDIGNGARALVESLLRLVDGQRPAPVQLPTRLILRESA